MLFLYFITIILISYYQFKFLSTLNIFLDKNTNKLQAVHKNLIPRSGGIGLALILLISLVFIEIIYELDYLKFYPFLICIFLIGLIDDYGFKINPNIRLLCLFIILLLFFYIFDLKLRTTGIGILDSFINIYNLQYITVSICFLIIINGSNFIDGVNGNLSIHYIILFLFIFLITPPLQEGLKIEVQSLLICFVAFLIFNLKNKLFFGDGGAYLSGAILGLLIIFLMYDDTSISPFFYIILTSYLGSEVLVSFIRRVIKKESGVIADFNHLHSMLFKIFKTKTKMNPHVSTTLLINLIYFIAVFPSLFFASSFEITRNYAIILYIFFILFYFVVKKIFKNLI